MYAGVDQIPGVRFLFEQDANGVSQLPSTSGKHDKASSANSESHSSSKIRSGGPGVAEIQSNIPHGPAMDTSPKSAVTDSTRARLDRHRARLAEMHSPLGTRDTVSDLPASLRSHATYHHTALQPDSGPGLKDSSAAQPHDSSFGGAQSPSGPRSPMSSAAHPHGASFGGVPLPPGPRLPVSDHAAAYLNQWNSGRAALSSRSSRTAVNGPSPQPHHSRSAVSAPPQRSNDGAEEITAREIEPRETAETSAQAPSARISVPGAPKNLDVMMGRPNVETLVEEESRHSEAMAPQTNPWTIAQERSAEKAHARAPEPISGLHADGTSGKHQRSEKKGDRKKAKEHKASGAVDIADARMRNSKEKHSEQTDDDDSDIQITSWNRLNANKTTGQNGGTKAGTTEYESGRNIKKGVAHVKKPKPKGQKGKTMATSAG